MKPRPPPPATVRRHSSATAHRSFIRTSMSVRACSPWNSTPSCSKVLSHHPKPREACPRAQRESRTSQQSRRRRLGVVSAEYTIDARWEISGCRALTSCFWKIGGRGVRKGASYCGNHPPEDRSVRDRRVMGRTGGTFQTKTAIKRLLRSEPIRHAPAVRARKSGLTPPIDLKKLRFNESDEHFRSGIHARRIDLRLVDVRPGDGGNDLPCRIRSACVRGDQIQK